MVPMLTFGLGLVVACPLIFSYFAEIPPHE